jgi:hypothetical protein
MIAHATAAIRERVGSPVGNLRCEGWEGPCDRTDAMRQRQNTAYVEDDRNWVTLCPDCMRANDNCWSERWSEYYSGCL